jgi:hypothetical protein
MLHFEGNSTKCSPPPHACHMLQLTVRCYPQDAEMHGALVIRAQVRVGTPSLARSLCPSRVWSGPPQLQVGGKRQLRGRGQLRGC